MSDQPADYDHFYDRIFEDVEEVLKILAKKNVPEPLDADYIFNRLETLNGHQNRLDIVVMEVVQRKRLHEAAVGFLQNEDRTSQGKFDSEPILVLSDDEDEQGSTLKLGSRVMVETLLRDNSILDAPGTSKWNAEGGAPAIFPMDFGAANYVVPTLARGYAAPTAALGTFAKGYAAPTAALGALARGYAAPTAALGALARGYAAPTAALGAPARVVDGQQPRNDALPYAALPNHGATEAAKRKLVNGNDTDVKRLRFEGGPSTSWAAPTEMLNASFAVEALKSIQKRNTKNVPATRSTAPHSADAAIHTVVHASLPAPQPDESRFIHYFTAIMEIFPDADPDYMLKQIQNQDDIHLKFDAIVQRILESKGYPKLADIMVARARDEELKKYKNGKCTAEEFLVMYEDPAKYFYDETRAVSANYTELAVAYLWKEFGKCTSKLFIRSRLKEHNNHYIPTFKQLQDFVSKLNRNGRYKSVQMPKVSDVHFYKELEFLRLETSINAILEQRKEQHAKKIEAARLLGVMLECSCCFDDGVLPEESVTCASEHVFCKECITRGVDVALGQGKAELQCMAGDCKQIFSLKVLQEALPAKNFSNFLKRLQFEELQKANLEDLVTCPHCSFAAIVPNPEDKLFHCLNEECRKVTCRLCGGENHLPLRCDEIEKDSETKMRVFIEERMNEALIRTCPKCGKRFMKSEGCNMMTCTCGARMCYVCRQPIQDYKHFERNAICQQNSDTQQLHQAELATGASTAKSEYLSSHPEMVGKDLKYDPTKDLTVNLNAPVRDLTGPHDHTEEEEEDSDEMMDSSSSENNFSEMNSSINSLETNSSDFSEYNVPNYMHRVQPQFDESQSDTSEDQEVGPSSEDISDDGNSVPRRDHETSDSDTSEDQEVSPSIEDTSDPHHVPRRNHETSSSDTSEDEREMTYRKLITGRDFTSEDSSGSNSFGVESD